MCPVDLLLAPYCIRCGKSVIVGKRHRQCSCSIRKCGMPAPFSISVATHLLPPVSGMCAMETGREICQQRVKTLAAQGDLTENYVNLNSVTTSCI